MFYVRPNHPYHAPRHPYPAAPSYYAQPEPEPYLSPDELARARYLQALREQRAARKAYADALAERELQRMEQQYGADADEPYTRFGAPRARRAAQPRYYEQPTEDDDDDEGFGYDSWADALRARALEQGRARALEQERAREIATEHERQRLRAAQLAAEQERQRALAAAEEERRQAHAYQQARAYADALAQKQMNSKQPNRKLGRVTPDVRPTPQTQQELSKPVRIHIRSRSTSPPRPAPAPPAPSADAQPAAPEPKTALSAIATVESALSKLRETFALPPQLEFKAPRELSYASTNAPVRAYEYELGKLLEKLDEVESAGVAEIRKERKRVVELVESALSDLERKVEEEWRKAHPEENVPVAKEDAQPRDEMEVEHAPQGAMEVDSTPAAAPSSTPAVEPTVEPAAAPVAEVEHPVEPMEVEPSVPVAAVHTEPALSDASVPAESATEQPTPSSVADSTPAESVPAPPAPSPADPELSMSTLAISSDVAPPLDSIHGEPAPPAVDTSQSVRISISQDAPASQDAQAVPVVGAQPVRIAISSSSEREDVPVVDRSWSDPAPATRDVAIASEADAHTSPAQRTDEFVML